MRHYLLLGVAVFGLVAPAVHAAELTFKPGEDSRFHWQDYEAFSKAHPLKGQTLTIFGPWRGEEKDQFETVLDYFRQATGADVKYSSSENYEQQIVIDTQAGSPPNIAILAQPGLIADLASKGELTPLGDDNADWLKKNYAAGESWVDLATYKGKDGKAHVFAMPYKVDLKSLIWYVPDNFADAGYSVPKTMEELKALTEKIAADGRTPWCIGLGSGGATGWPATDWVEDLMLRNYPAKVYDDWVTNKIKFDDPRVVKVIQDYGWFARNPKFVDGGTAGVSSTDYRDSPKGLFTSPPKCYMHHQASFITSYFPQGTEIGRDVDFFPTPNYASKPELGNPVEGGGTLAMVTKDSPAARAFIDFLKNPISAEVWMAQKNFLTASKLVNQAAYANPQMKKMGKIIMDATTFRFDGSDMMPGKIGTGAFWTGMVDYEGGKSADDVAKTIQAVWDGLKK
ncbi:ABC transporter substrate-binding protein [Allorhizobium sp. BGMRC 0089]|uniref:ABC transporter substrate-binding protein n=1 Tax=Allorhizobium sonneratiae TaxID=2934936 RepID=UPI0020339742|nr:ABC transporter substrate-binding protein [Allorhizobium sonneratiae]MCM2291370.1 ABC transporter substrate-binding protein [Allorhizobium sonneratiae]